MNSWNYLWFIVRKRNKRQILKSYAYHKCFFNSQVFSKSCKVCFIENHLKQIWTFLKSYSFQTSLFSFLNSTSYNTTSCCGSKRLEQVRLSYWSSKARAVSSSVFDNAIISFPFSININTCKQKWKLSKQKRQLTIKFVISLCSACFSATHCQFPQFIK